MRKKSDNKTVLNTSSKPSTDISTLAPIISECRTLDQHNFRSQLRKIKAETDTKKKAKLSDKLAADVQASLDTVYNKHQSLPKISFSDDLPINQRRDEIAKLIDENQVVVVAGETGSGKTTQIPKICLDLGLGNKGLIGHTQPRRIAARTVGKRIADEVKTPFGDIVGYQVRFAEQVSDNTRVKLMTDGVLLSEFQQDKFLNKYEVIIIDEAHERSLNIDFLLGLLKRLLQRRKDLKLIITSATIDLDKFSQHFSGAPVIEVSGRTFPVDVLYHPPADNKFNDLPDTICQTVEHIIDGEARGEFIAKGDILVFCSGERDIRDAAKALQDQRLPVDILPLYSRLGIAEQNKVFQKSNRRKVVLATNVAETSLTVPGIAYVIDPGLARISRYSYRSKVQRLAIEPISQASANQRKGRCGRVANGVCIRLYSEEDFNLRPEFTDAELLRSNLASVILQLLQLKVHDISEFPFLDKPDNRQLNDGFKLLDELEAIDKQQRLTANGRVLARLPLDPKYGRMLIAANAMNCLHEVLIIVAAMSIQDPREFPADKLQAAREKHRLLQHKKSDFYSFLSLWFVLEAKRKSLSNKLFKEYCKKNFINIVRLFEWRDMVRQLKQTVNQLQTAKQSNWQTADFTKEQINTYLPLAYKIANASDTENKVEAKAYNSIHQALLSGLLGNIAVHDDNNEYQATRGRKLVIFPSSVLSKKPKRKTQKETKSSSKQPAKNAKWIMANELIETSRLFAHTAAEIDPHWVLKAGEHLLHFNYSSPNYHEKSGAVKALRRASLYGLTLRDKVSVIYSDIDPLECRQLFIQQALVEGGFEKHPQYPTTQPLKKQDQHFFAHNKALIETIEHAEAKQRKRNLLISDPEIYQLYDELIPEEVVNWVQLEQWRKKAEQSNADLLKFKVEQLTINGEPLIVPALDKAYSTGDSANNSVNASNEASRDQTAFPESLEIDGKQLKLSYHFNPSDPNDGVTIELPIGLLEPFPDHIGDWLVPGLLREKCIALIKTLPKAIRKRYAPAAHAVDRVLPTMQPENRSLHSVLGERLKRTFGEPISDEAWNLDALDSYYKLNYDLVDSDESRTLIQQSRDLSALKQSYSEYVAESLKVENASERTQFEKQNITEWDFGELAESASYQHLGMTVKAYPMLRLNKDETGEARIDLLLHKSHEYATYFTRQACVELAKAPLKQTIRYLEKELFKKSSLQLLPIAPNKSAQKALANDIINASILHNCFATDIPRNRTAFNTAIEKGKANIIEYAINYENALLDSVKRVADIRRSISNLGTLNLAMDEIVEDIKQQTYELFTLGFLNYTTHHQLKQYSRYLKCMQIRLEGIHSNRMALPDNTISHMAKVDKYINEQVKAISDIEETLNLQERTQMLYMIRPEIFEHINTLAEWRVSLFAQQLRTQFPVSEKRINKHWAEVITMV